MKIIVSTRNIGGFYEKLEEIEVQKLEGIQKVRDVLYVNYDNTFKKFTSFGVLLTIV